MKIIEKKIEEQDGAAQKAAEDLGPMPAASVTLLSALAGVWLLIGLFALRGLIKKKRAEKRPGA